MKDNFYLEPVITVLSVPMFAEPRHMLVDFLGEATEGERLVEFAGRLCYMSQRNPAKRTTREYIDNIKQQAHGSVLEHANYSFLFEGVSRTFTHELVRHRAGFAYSQLSQRYVDESDCQFVVPPALLDIGGAVLDAWTANMLVAREKYQFLSDQLTERNHVQQDKTARRKAAREAARSVLPNSTETKIVVTANARAWRTMLELRCSEGAEREIRRCMVKVLRIFQGGIAPAFFNDFEIYKGADGHDAARSTFHKV